MNLLPRGTGLFWYTERGRCTTRLGSKSVDGSFERARGFSQYYFPPGFFSRRYKCTPITVRVYKYHYKGRRTKSRKSRCFFESWILAWRMFSLFYIFITDVTLASNKFQCFSLFQMSFFGFLYTVNNNLYGPVCSSTCSDNSVVIVLHFWRSLFNAFNVPFKGVTF